MTSSALGVTIEAPDTTPPTVSTPDLVARAAAEGVLNDRVRLDRHKKGFNAAFRSLFDLKNPKTRERILDDGPIFDLVRRDRIEEAMSMEDLPNSFSKFLFSFVSAKLFMEHWA